MPLRHPSQSQSGNVIWFILVAIVLLGALTMALSRSGSSVNQSGDSEKSAIVASQLIRYASGLEAAIGRMRLAGIGENEISFDDSALTGYTNTVCNEDRCRLFKPDGGGMRYIAPPSGANDGSAWLFTAANNIEGVGEDAGESDEPSKDLIALLPNVPLGLCKEVNRLNRIDSPPPADTSKMDIATKFTGTFSAGEAINPGGAVAGKKAGCVQGNQDQANANIAGKYYFYYVLIAR